MTLSSVWLGNKYEWQIDISTNTTPMFHHPENIIIATACDNSRFQGVSQKKKFCPLNVNWESFFDRSKSLIV
jgi:hypothetical protein